MNIQETMQQYINQLNQWSYEYYVLNNPTVSDKEWDDTFDKLKKLEDETGIIFPDSPTRTVGALPQTGLTKVKHSHPMLSLSKTKEISDIIKFANKLPVICMLKMDGLTVSLHYNEHGDLISAETRGNGEVGENIFNNVKMVENIPLKINNSNMPLTIDGEVIIKLDKFIEVNNANDQIFSHPRNLAASSIRLLDANVTKERSLSFIAWRIIEGVNTNNFNEMLDTASALGFETVPYSLINNFNNIADIINKMRNKAKELNYPIDGLVFSYNDINYGLSLGVTSHHPLHSKAFKFYDEEYETELIDIEWQVGRTGLITPVAVFKDVEIDGAIISRASLHNLSILSEKLGKPYVGQKVFVIKCNMIIPQISRAEKYEE